MNIFNPFRKRKDTLNNEEKEPFHETIVDPALFMETKDPASGMVQPSDQPVSSLDRFLKLNYEWYGYSEGYGNPASDFMDIKLNALRMTFLQELDRSIDMKRQEIGTLNVALIRMSGITTRMDAEIREKLRQLEQVVEELLRQKGRSVGEEGWLSAALAQYRLGFMRGTERYMQEKVFAGSTGLFTK
jgi:hypothetical protein